jgi:mannosyl-3-phosphoglycerate phosphatase
MPLPQIIVFSDLDGTLLDHENYSHAAACPALEALKRKDIPLILASSKTSAEIYDLRTDLGFPHCPAIVENGAGVLEPAGTGTAADDTSIHRRLIAILDSLPLRLREKFSGFSDWSVHEIAANTGLAPASAEKAAMRRYSEPGIWWGDDEEKAEFIALLAEKGVSAKQGGRYLALSFGATKADRMREIAGRYAVGGKRPRTLALGDAPNDIEMLEAADMGVVVTNPHTRPLPELDGESIGRIVRTEKTGPEGWNEAVLRIIEELDDG